MTEYHVDRDAWQQRDVFAQMANIGADVGRTIAAWRRGQAERFEAACDRALDLFSASVEQLASEHSPRLKEVCRAREEFLGLFASDDFDQAAERVERYYMDFAAASRMGVRV